MNLSYSDHVIFTILLCHENKFPRCEKTIHVVMCQRCGFIVHDYPGLSWMTIMAELGTSQNDFAWGRGEVI